MTSQRITLATAAMSLAVSLATLAMLLFLFGKLSAVDRTLGRTDAAIAAVADKLDNFGQSTQPVSVEAIEYVPVSITLRTHDNRPVTGLSVELRPSDGTKEAGGLPTQGTTDDDGRVRFPIVRAGTYTLSVDDDLAEWAGLDDADALSGASVRAVSSGAFVVPLGKPLDVTYTLPQPPTVQAIEFAFRSAPSAGVMQDIALVTENDESLPAADAPVVTWKPPFEQIGWLLNYRIDRLSLRCESTEPDNASLSVAVSYTRDGHRLLGSQLAYLAPDGTIFQLDDVDGESMAGAFQQDDERLWWSATALDFDMQPAPSRQTTYSRGIGLRVRPLGRLDRRWIAIHDKRNRPQPNPYINLYDIADEFKAGKPVFVRADEDRISTYEEREYDLAVGTTTSISLRWDQD